MAYAPMAAYLGREGYCLEFELHEGKQHCQKETPALLERVLERASRLTPAPLLLRLDGGNDAIENIAVVLAHNHGTSEQYHSEFKTDLDIERLPSGKFATNALVLSCAQVAYNILAGTKWHDRAGCAIASSGKASSDQNRDCRKSSTWPPE